MAVASLGAASPFQQSWFESDYKEDNRVVSGGESGGEIVSEGDLSAFLDEKEGGDMGKDQFLQLLVTQLQNQDPMEPAADTEFVAQLATFSELESSQNIESALVGFTADMKGMIESQSAAGESFASTAVTGLLGKEARVEAGEVYYDGKTKVDFKLHADNPREVYLRVDDSEGRQILLTKVENSDPNAHDLAGVWDGIDAQQSQLPPGKYNISVTDITGRNPAGYIYEEAPVTGVSYDNGQAQISINGKNFAFTDLKQIVDAEPTTTPES